MLWLTCLVILRRQLIQDDVVRVAICLSVTGQEFFKKCVT